jgi:hypothetical protein
VVSVTERRWGYWYLYGGEICLRLGFEDRKTAFLAMLEDERPNYGPVELDVPPRRIFGLDSGDVT